MPVVGQGGTPGQPPMGGAGGATMPMMNRGAKASGLAYIQQAVRILEKAIQVVGAETELGKDVIQVLTKLTKHIGAGASPGVENSALQKLMAEQKSEAPLLQQLRSQGGGGGGTAPPPGGGGAAPPQMAG